MEYIKQKYPYETSGNQDLFYAFSKDLKYFKPIEILHLASQSMNLLAGQLVDLETIAYFKEANQLVQNAELNLQTTDFEQREKLFNQIESSRLNNQLMEIPKLNDQLVPLEKPIDAPNNKANDKLIKRSKRGRLSIQRVCQ